MIGSVFLGDLQRSRVFSNPTTPPPLSPTTAVSFQSMVSVPDSPSSSSGASSSSSPSAPVPATVSSQDQQQQAQPPPLPLSLPTGGAAAGGPVIVDPVLALELRLRWLEALLVGVQKDSRKKGKDRERTAVIIPSIITKNGQSLLRLAGDVQRRLNEVVNGNEGLKRFMVHYDQYSHLLTPAFALAGLGANGPPSYESMTAAELDAYLREMEPDIRAAERDMREIELLEKKGVTGAGKLADYEELLPRLEALIKAHEDDERMASSLEKRLAVLMERHTTQVDALSELFVSWDDVITSAEERIVKIERAKDERRRLGYE